MVVGAAWAWVGGADRHGGMARWRSMWWITKLARLAVVGFNIVVVNEIDSFFVFFFFFPLGDYVVVVSCGCGCWWWFLKASLCFFFFSMVALSYRCGWWVVWRFELWVCLDW